MPATGYNIVQRVREETKRGAGKKSEKGDPSFTSAQVAGLINRYKGSRWHDRNHNGKTELTYAFSTVKPRWFEEFNLGKRGQIEKIIPLSLPQQDFIRRAQQEYADVANITFTEKAGGGGEGHLTYRGYTSRDEASADAGMGYTPGPYYPKQQGTIWMNNLDPDNLASPEEAGFRDNYWRSVLIHELGHGLGMAHPHSEENEKPEIPLYAEKSRNYSIMGYDLPILSETQDTPHPVSLMLDDIQAIQSKYGANYSTRKGNTTYGFNSNTNREHYSLKSSQEIPFFSVWDGGGWDTLDFSQFTQDQTINLNAGTFSSVGGLRDNVSIAHGVTVEEARGGQGKNTLIGNAAFNILRGGRDRDILYGGSGGAQMWGGEGADTFVFDATSSGKPNLVMDFVSGKDKIDLSGMRRQSGPLKLVSRLPLDRTKPQNPNNPTFITQPGDVLVSYDRTGQQTLLRMDTTGDGKMDMQVYVRGKVAREDIVV
ncbi:Serralysin precursor [Pseudomonas sp. 58 R 3]|nr:Serralysin precursor [Pseudomonas sp. 58 R 3]